MHRGESTSAGPSACVLLAIAALAGCAGDPQPAPGTEPNPEATPRASATPAPSAKPKVGRIDPLRYAAREHGLLVRDPVTGFSFTTPGTARVEGGGGQGPLAYELQAKAKGWSLRVRREATKGKNAAKRAEALVRARALQTPVEIAPFREGACKRWQVEAASVGTYPLGKGEAWERVIVLVRDARAIVLWETVDAGLGRARITELNARFYASFRWGGSPVRMDRAPSPLLDTRTRLTAEAKVLSLRLRKSIVPDDLARAEALLASFAYSAADPPDLPLDPNDRAAIEDKLRDLRPKAAKRLLAALKKWVKTPRDLRGLHLAVEAALP